jgi:signal peptidase II
MFSGFAAFRAERFALSDHSSHFLRLRLKTKALPFIEQGLSESHGFSRGKRQSRKVTKLDKMEVSVDKTELNTKARTRIGWRFGYLLACFGLYMVDQTTKAWAVRALRFQGDRTIIQGFFDLVYTENRGIAFGQLQEGGSLGRWFFVGLAIVAAAAVFYYFVRTPRNDDRVLGACALLLAGIAGNLTDRARLGYVIDFIVLHAHSYHWPTFNVADASITIGALLLACDLVFDKKKSVVST